MGPKRYHLESGEKVCNDGYKKSYGGCRPKTYNTKGLHYSTGKKHYGKGIIKGPKGGFYYWAANGKRVYVSQATAHKYRYSNRMKMNSIKPKK